MAKQHHSRSYHRYFENYAEKEVLSPRGGYEIQRVYVGNYYTVDLPEQAFRRGKWVISLGFVLSLAGFLLGGLQAEISAVSFVAIATMPALVAEILLAVSVFYRLTVPREMEIREYRDSSENLCTRSVASVICLAICLLATLIGCIALPGHSLSGNLPALICYLLALVGALMVSLQEKNTPYKTLPPRAERPVESSPIRYEMPE